MLKIDKPPGRADLHKGTLLSLADTENKCDSPTPKSFIRLNHSSAVTLVY